MTGRRIVHNGRSSTQPNSGNSYTDELQNLMKEYAENPSQITRGKIVTKLVPYLTGIAKNVRNQRYIHPTIDIQDLVLEGLLKADPMIDRYDPRRGVPIEQFIGPTAKGAMLDHLGSQDFVPRRARERETQVRYIQKTFLKEKNRLPSEEEIVKALKEEGYTEKAAEKVLKGSRIPRTSSLSQIPEELTSRGHGSQYSARNNVEDLKETITKGLSRSEKLIVILYYYEGMTMKEIGATLGITESRVSQVHTDIISRLRDRKRELEDIAEE